MVVVCMEENKPVQNEVAEESERDKERNGRGGVILRAERYRFRQEVKERDACDRTGREAEYEMELVAEL